MGAIRRCLQFVLIALGLLSISHAYPDYFLQTFTNSNNCIEHPTTAYGGHGTPQADRQTTMLLTPNFTLSETPKKLCPGANYIVKVTFPEPRLGLLTSATGAFAGAPDQMCPNRIITPNKAPVTVWEVNFQVACTAAGQDVQFMVTSAQSSGSNFKASTVTIGVAPATGACAQVSATCTGETAGEAVVPVSRFDPTTGLSELDGVSSGLAQAPVYSLRPILKGNRSLWQFLHGLLMLTAFGGFLPVGVLMARHKWMFGANPHTNKVSSTWFYLHLGIQLVGVLCALGGLAIAVLGFGWKYVPGQKLYQPHKWMGVAVMAMALVQLLLSICRPAPTASNRPCWNFLHWSWGRLILLGGAANVVLGAVLAHDYHGLPYKGWLLASCLLIGVVVLLGMILEAFKMQMQRTYRYNPKTADMLPVLEGYKKSKRRAGHGSNLPDQQQMEQPMYTSTERSDDAARAAISNMQYPPVQYGFAVDTVNTTDQMPRV